MKITNKIKRLLRIFERKFLFYFLQIIILIISIIIIKNNFLISQDINARSIFNNIRYSEWTNIYQKLNYQPTAEEPYKDKVVLIWIDQKFFSKENISIQWFHRWYYAKALKNIEESKPKVIWIDVFFEKPYNYKWNSEKIKILNKVFKEYDRQLSSTLNSNTIIAWAYNFFSKQILKPDELFLKNWTEVWHIHSEEVKDINLWIYPPLKSWLNQKDKIDPLSLKVYWKRKQKNNKNLKNYQKQILIKNKKDFVKIEGISQKPIYLPKSSIGKNKFIANPIYFWKKEEFNYISFYDIYKWNFDKERLKNKVVLIWATDPTLHDVKLTLKGEIPWVIVHANAVLSMMANDHIYILSPQKSFIFIFSIIFLNILLIWIFKNSTWISSIFYLLIIEIIIAIFISITFALGFIWEYSIYLPLATLIIIIFLQLIINLLYAIVETSSVKESFQKLFNLYVWEKLSQKTKKDIDDIWEKIAEEKEIAIFFSDIAGFTNLSEKLTPNQNVFFLNEYLEKMSEEISKYKWFIDKYIWDAIMAFWEESNGCELAANSAIWNILALEWVNQKINSQLEWFEEEIKLSCRIWLNAGKSIIGDIWAENYKLNYTIIWDNVNLAARLEGINKFYWTQICISEYFYEKIKHNAEYMVRKLDKIKVKWKEKAIKIYELYPTFRWALTQTQKKEYEDFIYYFEKWLEQYFEWNFSEAINNFENALLIKKDYACKVFIKRSQKLLENPIADWNWIREFKEK